MKPLLTSTCCFAVFVRRKDGTEFLALRGNGTLAVFSDGKAARAFARELREHRLKSLTRRVSISEVPW